MSHVVRLQHASGCLPIFQFQDIVISDTFSESWEYRYNGYYNETFRHSKFVWDLSRYLSTWGNKIWHRWKNEILKKRQFSSKRTTIIRQWNDYKWRTIFEYSSTNSGSEATNIWIKCDHISDKRLLGSQFLHKWPPWWESGPTVDIWIQQDAKPIVKRVNCHASLHAAE